MAMNFLAPVRWYSGQVDKGNGLEILLGTLDGDSQTYMVTMYFGIYVCIFQVFPPLFFRVPKKHPFN